MATDVQSKGSRNKQVTAASRTQRLVQRHDERQDYETPPDFFAKMEAEFGPFDLDVAAVASTAKVPRFFSPEDDGLSQDWSGRCWMNPPYGRATAAWVRKAREEAQRGALVVCLLPARTDTKWWQDNIWSEKTGKYPWVRMVRFIRGRINFWTDGGPTLDENGRPCTGKFPSAVVVFGAADFKRNGVVTTRNVINPITYHRDGPKVCPKCREPHVTPGTTTIEGVPVWVCDVQVCGITIAWRDTE